MVNNDLNIGYPIHAAPFGVELYAWFKPTVDQAS
jgi:hypothetical protein